MDRAKVGCLGFSLTEVLIAVFLFLLLGVAIGNLSFLAHSVLHRSDRQLWLSQEPRRLLDWMSEDVAQATSITVFSGGWGVPANVQPIGVAGDRVELTIDDGTTPTNPGDDDLVRYTWTRNDPNPPQNSSLWDAPSLGDLIRRFSQSRPSGTGDWSTNDIVAGLGEDRNAGGQAPDTIVVAVTNFQVTQTADPNSSQLNPKPQNVLRVDVTVSQASQSLPATYYLQSRALRAERP